MRLLHRYRLNVVQVDQGHPGDPRYDRGRVRGRRGLMTTYVQWENVVTRYAERTIMRFAWGWPNVTMDEQGRLHFGEQMTEPVPLNTPVRVRVDSEQGLYWIPTPDEQPFESAPATGMRGLR